jgi:CheY-like chemotaxis protein
MKILIVDDEQDVEIMFLQKFRREIKSKLLEVEFAFSGQQALDYLGQDQVLRMSCMFFPISICPV